MRSERSNFEVFCPHCDVTFPVGNRHCTHCGGATIASSSDAQMSSSVSPVFDFDAKDEPGAHPGIHEEADSRAEFDVFETFPFDSNMEDETPIQQTYSQAGSQPDSEAPSLGRSILGSMGSLIWIAMLILFSISGRVCGE